MSDIQEDQALRPTAEYRLRLEAGDVPFQRCTSCSRAIFFPRVLCPGCGSTSLEWERSGGRGVMYSATTVPVRDSDPYVVGLVDLEEGVRVMVRYVGEMPSQDAIGSAVSVSVGRVEDEPVLIAETPGSDAR